MVEYVLPNFQNALIWVNASLLNDGHWDSRLNIQEQVDASAVTRPAIGTRLLVAGCVVHDIRTSGDWSVQHRLTDSEKFLQSFLSAEVASKTFPEGDSSRSKKPLRYEHVLTMNDGMGPWRVEAIHSFRCVRVAQNRGANVIAIRYRACSVHCGSWRTSHEDVR